MGYHMNLNVLTRICGVALLYVLPSVCLASAVVAKPVSNIAAVPSATVPMAIAERGVFDFDRWDMTLNDIRSRAAAAGVSDAMIKSTMRHAGFIPSIVHSDKNQSEFKLTMDQYLARTVNQTRIAEGKKMRAKYPTMLNRVENRFGVPPHVILAFWGMESNYGTVKARHKLTDAFFTLIYEGRRQKFFSNQLISLMQIADKNGLDINDIHGSWAGAMGHFQFIPTTLAQYGVDGNNDGRIDIINSIGDAMFSAGNYLNKLGWNPNERIARRVILPADFDLTLLDGKTKLPLASWANMGVLNPDGTPIPVTNMTAGLIADTAAIDAVRAQIIANAATSAPGSIYGDPNAVDTDVAPRPVITAYLTYPNFYRIKKWNNSNWYALAIASLSDELR